jgi:hypothetical protein
VAIADFTRYVPPGVYVEDTSQPIVVATGIPTSTVTIVGPSRGYQNATESFQLFSQTNTVLLNRGVFVSGSNPVNAPVPVVTKTDGTLLTADVDYAFTVDTTDGGGPSNAKTLIRRLSSDISNPQNPAQASPGGLADGDPIVITYTYADSSYYTPTEMDDPDLVGQRYGDAVSTDIDTAGTILSPMTLAAQMAFTNGANSVLCVPVDQTNNTITLRDQFKNAYVKLEADYRVTMLVPLFVGVTETGSVTNAPTLASFINDLKSHCVNSSNDGYGRIAFVGAPKEYESTTDFSLVSTAVASKRVVLTYPARVSYYNGAVNRVVDTDGHYLAAAATGLLAAGAVQRGLTKLSVNGFSGLPSSVFQKMAKSYKDNLSRNGVCVFELNRSTNLQCRHGVATDMTALNTREISLTRQGDTLFADIFAGMDNSGLIGEPITADMTTRVKSALVGILETAKLTNVIVDYANVAVRQQTVPSGDPTIIECRFQYLPAVPLNYITVAFSIDLSTGASDLGNATSAVT